MKKISILYACLWAAVVYAQYPQALPITHTAFFATNAMGDYSTLEKGAYTTSSDSILANQWNTTYNTGAQMGASPVVENSTLSYSNYVDNNAGKAIVLSSTNGTRRSVYSLTSGNEYISADFYLSMLINFSSAPSSPTYFLNPDGVHTNNGTRGCVFVKAATGGFQIGMAYNYTSSNVAAWSSTLSYDQTHLIVVKVRPEASGAENYTFYLNPTIGGLESSETPLSNYNLAAAELKRIRAITIQQRTDIGAKIAGMRFSDKWADVVSASNGTPPVATALPAPEVGAATNLAARSFTANWTPVENATGYTVMVYSGTTFVDSTVVNGQGTSSVAVANMIPELTYTYKVKAKGNGTSYINSELSASSQEFTLPVASIPANKLKIILKLDDLGVLKGVLEMAPAFDFMVANNIKWAAGAIANHVDTTSAKVLAPYINAQNEKGEKLLEIWHHGYDHSHDKPVGTYEFKGRAYADQKASFEKANLAIKNLLGVQMHSFGSPYNKTDATTNTAISENPNYKVMMFSSVKSSTNGILYLDNRVNMEYGTGNPEFSYFVKNYLAVKNKITNYMILQGHPNSYSTGSVKLEQFKLILKYLKSEGVEFVTPYEYYQSRQNTAINQNWSNTTDQNLNFNISPNPAKNQTTLSFDVNEARTISLGIYNLNGALVKQHTQAPFATGKNNIQLDITDLQTGIYACRLTDSKNTAVQKLIVN